MIIYEGDLLDRATSSVSLDIRLKANAKYSSTNFNEWLMERLQVRRGMDILDVGCGNGAQTIPFSRLVGEHGSVSAIDLSSESIQTLSDSFNGMGNIQAVCGDMAELGPIIAEQFKVKRYDLAHSSYALYYSKDRYQVLHAMRSALKKEGRLAIFTPNEPHGMVDFVKQFTEIPLQVEQCFVFGPDVLESYFRKHFWDVSIFLFHNVVRIPLLEDVMNFYRVTTYYDADSDKKVKNAVQTEIENNGYFEYEKNGYLIIGQQQFH